MSSQPLISVVLPLHNGAQFVEWALRSLAAQTLTAELVVVDDGSTDDGVALVRRLAPEALVISTGGKGVACARNAGAFAARGDLVAFVDQDDFWHPDRLRSAVGALGDADAVVTGETGFGLLGDREAFASNAALVPQRLFASLDEAWSWSTQRTLPSVTPRLLAVQEIIEAPIATTTSFLFRREFFFRCGGFPVHARSVDDYLLTLNAARLGRLLLARDDAVMYRIRPDSTFQTGDRWLPYLTSLLAVTRGGQVPPSGQASQLPGTAEHLLLELAATGRLRDAAALARLLGGVQPSRLLRARLRALRSR